MTNIQRGTTEVISVSLPIPIVKKLEKERSIRGQSRSAFIASLIGQIAEEERWQRIYKKGTQTAVAFEITSEEDIDKILHEV
ncbi:MAG: hypothetical protein UU34_C0033G0006 [Candidatus Curtissbacteria bacterium GW2011_GWA1_41_11]|uniref:Ribbon-helix-helix protein CopG domain-containing protein n=1 Tax=Candidatus Curtissbacteria bacterium GW2011_GWA1_41_11 TaxID=1618409 RepID=A0A0G0XDI3_9BACT|nr:MAG: hypothetical protein UU34_C0033G0006 [Candidatus Curtissbacteria bacterium GW2011_GWA1_41_11]